MTTALFIGRFQPFHNGHLRAVEDILGKHDSIIIAIGSAQEKGTEENPFSLVERKEMIKKALDSRGIGNYFMGFIEDFNDDRKWTEAIKKKYSFDVVYSHNPWTIRCFEKFGRDVKKHRLYHKDIYAGTVIRQRIIRGEEWKELVPPEVYGYVKSINGEERIRKRKPG